MKETILVRYKKFKNPNVGSIPTLAQAIFGMHYGRQKVLDFFNKNIPKSEFDKSEKDEIINWLLDINKMDNLPKIPFKKKKDEKI
jgi:hypothetical protein